MGKGEKGRKFLGRKLSDKKNIIKNKIKKKSTGKTSQILNIIQRGIYRKIDNLKILNKIFFEIPKKEGKGKKAKIN